jgi:polysaccharide deacetylase family protein (PEP-CTERM system associated)
MKRAPAEVTFTFDLEYNEASAWQTRRFTELTDEVLDALDEHGVQGTVFVVGELVETHPAVVKSIAARGHEIGLHGWTHQPLSDLEPAMLAAHLERGRGALADLTGQDVAGYRAPTFSLVRTTSWAVDVIRDAGFEYSSSIMPARHPLYGFPECPHHPFRWPNGLVELPCPVLRVPPLALGYLGGIYLRLLPPAIVRRGVDRARAGSLLWTYCHPYDFDADEPFFVMEPLGRLGSRLMWVNRRNMLDRIRQMHEGRPGRPLRARIADPAVVDALETFAMPSGARA